MHNSQQGNMQNTVVGYVENACEMNSKESVSFCSDIMIDQYESIVLEQLNEFGHHTGIEHTPEESPHHEHERSTLVDNFNMINGSSDHLPEAPRYNHELTDDYSNRDETSMSRRRDQTRESPNRKPMLPPCKICGETATGYHYGANTCEACKGFFRRNLKKAEVRYKCKCTPEQREIWKRGPTKDGCQACRYQRCLAVGMSRTAIKLGRYTYIHKTRNIKQAKYHEAVESCKQEDPISPVDCTASLSPNDSSLLDFYCRPYSPEDCSMSTSPDCVSRPDRLSIQRKLEAQKNLQNMGITLEECDYIVTTVTEAHMATAFPGNISTETIRRTHTDYLERCNSKHDSTVDPDIKVQKYWVANLFKVFEDNIVKSVSFAKKVPGFRDLTLDDQASLIRASRVEISLFNAYKYLVTHIEPERNVLTSPWGEVVHLDLLGHVLPSEIILLRYRYAKRLTELKLSTPELVILQAIVTVAPDKCHLEQPDCVYALQQKLFACLEYLLNSRTGGSRSLLYKILNLITDVRQLTDTEEKMTKNMLHVWQTLSDNNFHLLKEVGT